MLVKKVFLFIKQGDESVLCVHVKEGVIVRLDQHKALRKEMQELARLHAANSKKKAALRKKIIDMIMLMFFPGPSCDVDVISDPDGSTNTMCAFSNLR